MRESKVSNNELRERFSMREIVAEEGQPLQTHAALRIPAGRE
jgi:hypothetical protein